MNNDLKKKFINLVFRLSPENLYCDGELTRAQAHARHRQIMREWKDLEKEAGRSVSQSEAEQWAYSS